MAAALDTSDGREAPPDVNINNEEYMKIMRAPLNQQKLLRIADTVQEIAEQSLSDLLDWSKAMTEAVANMKRQFNASGVSNRDPIKAQLLVMGEALKQRIDQKIQAVGSVVDGLYRYYQRDEVTRRSGHVHSPNVVTNSKSRDDYETKSYISDDALAMSEKQNKLIAANQGVVAELDKLITDISQLQILSSSNSGTDSSNLTDVPKAQADDHAVTWKPPRAYAQLQNEPAHEPEEKVYQDQERAAGAVVLYQANGDEDWKAAELPGHVRRRDMARACRASGVQSIKDSFLKSAVSGSPPPSKGGSPGPPRSPDRRSKVRNGRHQRNGAISHH